MSRKRLIKTLRAYGENTLSGRKLETCYTADLMIALQQKTDGKRLRGHKNRIER
jgi:hypothetical protein